MNKLLKLLKSNNLNKFSSLISCRKLPDEFANFFKTIIDNIHKSLLNDSNICHNEEIAFDGISFDQFALVSPDLIHVLFQSLNSTTCTLDPISTSVLKQCSSGVTCSIAGIVNKSLESSTDPPDLKKAIISPLLKKQNLDENALNNYRPISHLPFLSKVLEKVVVSQLIEHLTTNGLLDDYWSAY